MAFTEMGHSDLVALRPLSTYPIREGVRILASLDGLGV